MSIYYAPDNMLAVLPELSHFILAASLWNMYLFYSYLQMRKLVVKLSTMIKITQLNKGQSRDLNPGISMYLPKETKVKPTFLVSLP